MSTQPPDGDVIEFGTIEVHHPPRPGEPAGIDLVALVGPGSPCHCGAASIARVGSNGQTPVCIRCLAGVLRTARAIGEQLADPPPSDDRFASVRWLERRHPVLRELASRLPGAIDFDGDIDPHAIAAAIDTYDGWSQAGFGNVPCQHPHDADGEHDHSECEAESNTAAAGALCRMSGTERNRLRLVAAFGPRGVRFGVNHLSGFDQEGRRLVIDWLAAVDAH